MVKWLLKIAWFMHKGNILYILEIYYTSIQSFVIAFGYKGIIFNNLA